MKEKRKVVIVDDERDFCYFIKMNLEATGDFEVSVCCDSTEAVGHVKKLHPDLVLLDILMPGLSGPEIAEELGDKVDTREIPVVFLTAVATEEDTEERDNVIGGNYVVAKPVKITKLRDVINKALGYQIRSS
jgi:CheY-like chemotaxis protein